jgi:hypothetical protein
MSKEVLTEEATRFLKREQGHWEAGRLVEALLTFVKNAPDTSEDRATTAQRQRDGTADPTQETLERIERKIDLILPGKQGLPTYAAALTSGILPAAQRTRATQLPPTHDREIIVHKNNDDDDHRTNEEVVQAINAATGANDAIAVRKLPSGDWRVIFKSRLERQKHVTNDKWAQKAFGGTATVQQRLWQVVLFAMQTSEVLNYDPEALLGRLNMDNRGLKAVKAAAPRKARNKSHTVLYISFGTAAEAERACRDGMVFQGSWFRCEPYCEGSVAKQCYQCKAFGHAAKFCRSPRLCGWCGSKDHEEEQCEANRKVLGAEAKRARCVNCRGPHPAWSIECQVKMRRVEEARIAFHSRPLTFGIDPAPSPSDEGWQIVQAPRRKSRASATETQSDLGTRRPVGRPQGTTDAAKNNQKITDFALPRLPRSDSVIPATAPVLLTTSQMTTRSKSRTPIPETQLTHSDESEESVDDE